MPLHLDQLKSTFESFSDAWRTNDGAAVASFFAEDGAIISPFGQRAEGRTAIAAMYSEHFGGMLRGTSTTFSLSSVRPVEGNHALPTANRPSMARMDRSFSPSTSPPCCVARRTAGG